MNQYWDDEIGSEPDWIKFCAIVKATLIAADVAASALWEHPEKPEERTNWIAESLTQVANADDLQSIITQRLNGNKPFDFQNQIADSNADITLVEAGCGSGKTLAAYMWFAQQHLGRRLWFCYPTTGTATEGYKGHLHEQLGESSSSSVGLFDSRASFDVREMLANNQKNDALIDSAIRIESLKSWNTQIVACTVDTVLCLLQNHRRGIYAWPALAHSAIVFDEVHCYDEKLFGNLLTWLRHMVGIPVLVMTASLPNGRRQAIEQVAQETGRSFHHVPNGPANLVKLPRYAAHLAAPVLDISEVEKLVDLELANQGRVLWISNTVARTRAVADLQLHAEPGL